MEKILSKNGDREFGIQYEPIDGDLKVSVRMYDGPERKIVMIGNVIIEVGGGAEFESGSEDNNADEGVVRTEWAVSVKDVSAKVWAGQD